MHHPPHRSTIRQALRLALLLLALASPALANPTMATPPPDSVLPGSTATFTWTDGGIDVVEWWIYVGTSQGTKNIVDSLALPVETRSYTVDALPINGSQVWVQLWWRLASDQSWHARDVRYHAASPSPREFPSVPRVTFHYTFLEATTDTRGEPLTNLESTELRLDVEGDPYGFFYFEVPATSPTGGGSPEGHVTIPLDVPEGSPHRVSATIRSRATDGTSSGWIDPVDLVGPFTTIPGPQPAPGEPMGLMLSVITCIECQVNVRCVEPCRVEMTPTPPAEGGDSVP